MLLGTTRPSGVIGHFVSQDGPLLQIPAGTAADKIGASQFGCHSNYITYYETPHNLPADGDLDTVTTQLKHPSGEEESIADGQIIFSPFAKEARGRRLTALSEVNWGRAVTSNLPSLPPHSLTRRKAST
ncbi:hypothetical protein CRENBAI_008639, partial [Crenichthys baileyi]